MASRQLAINADQASQATAPAPLHGRQIAPTHYRSPGRHRTPARSLPISKLGVCAAAVANGSARYEHHAQGDVAERVDDSQIAEDNRPGQGVTNDKPETVWLACRQIMASAVPIEIISDRG